jgi:hypothetical protein
MNEKRRKALRLAITEAESLKSTIEQLRDEEQDYYDCMPEGLQSGNKGDAAQETIQQLEEAIASAESVIDALNVAASTTGA